MENARKDFSIASSRTSRDLLEEEILILMKKQQRILLECLSSREKARTPFRCTRDGRKVVNSCRERDTCDTWRIIRRRLDIDSLRDLAIDFRQLARFGKIRQGRRRYPMSVGERDRVRGRTWRGDFDDRSRG